MREAVVPQSHVGLLYEDGAFKRELAPGRHKLQSGFFDKTNRMVQLVDLRERSLTIKGQETLTNDKVAIRVSLLVYFRIQSAQLAAHNVANYEERIYEDVQLAARRFLASRTLDAILSDRNEISDAVRDEVREAAAGYGVEILRADVKDLVFPGNLREIMNQVLETERRAEANLIQARKDAEAMSVKTKAQNEAEMRRLEAETERQRVQLEAERERRRNELEAAQTEAAAIAKNPTLFKLKQLDVLRGIARDGGKFVLGIEADGLRSALQDPVDD